MYSTTLALALAFFFLQLAPVVDAGIFILTPELNSTCHGGQECTISWLDDGNRPLLNAAGVCTFGLYHGNMQLVQAIPSVDVSTTHSISFKPIPAAGPNSNSYYIAIISITAKTNTSSPYIAFSPFFKLDQMTGSFDSPLPEATSTISIPSSLTHSGTTSTTSFSTITVGNLSTSESLPPPPTVTSTSPTTKVTTTSVSSQSRLTTSNLSSLTSPSITTSSVASTVASSAFPVTTSLANDATGRVPPALGLMMAILPLSSLLLSLL